MLIEQIRRAAVGASGVPAALFFGRVTARKPLKVQVDSHMELGEAQLVTLRGENFELGDKLVLLRDNGGQQFLILGRR